MTSGLPGSGPAALPSGLIGDQARSIFGERLALAERFAEWLAEDGVVRGLIGPREAARLWERHLLNCAVVTELLPPDARVVDVGSGAGLPGLAMAIRRPDLRVDLVEPMARRTSFLTEVVADLGLAAQIRLFRGRAEDGPVLRDAGGSDWVVARAVAPLDRLVRWCLPLLAPGGRLLAMKGSLAAAEVSEHERELKRLGATCIEVVEVGGDVLELGACVVVVEQAAARRRASSREGAG